MCPAATSTTMPSGIFRPSLTMVFSSEPSGFTEMTLPPLRSKKKRRPKAGFAGGFVDFDLEAVEDIEFACSFSEVEFDLELFEDRGDVPIPRRFENLNLF